MGNYNPDWSLAFDIKDIKYIYFIAGTMQQMKLRTVEKAKIICAKKHFEAISDGKIKYGVVNTYEELIDLITGVILLN